MPTPREAVRSGLDSLREVTTLLQRVRCADATAGPYQAAEVQFWWTRPRSTDTLDQLFWFDDRGPVAAVIATDFGDSESLVYGAPVVAMIVMPGSSPEWVDHVVDRGVAHVVSAGIEKMEMEVDPADDVMLAAVARNGFVRKDDAVVECWLPTGARPAVSPLAAGYRLLSRSDTIGKLHHLETPQRPDFERRIRETSLYRPDLDLFVIDADGNPAAYGLFWYDPVTATGVVEPMRTFDEHQQRGLARHLLTSGIDRLARLRATRISICYEPENPASGSLYRSVGFQAHRRTDLFARSARDA